MITSFNLFGSIDRSIDPAIQLIKIHFNYIYIISIQLIIGFSFTTLLIIYTTKNYRRCLIRSIIDHSCHQRLKYINEYLFEDVDLYFVKIRSGKIILLFLEFKLRNYD